MFTEKPMVKSCCLLSSYDAPQIFSNDDKEHIYNTYALYYLRSILTFTCIQLNLHFVNKKDNN